MAGDQGQQGLGPIEIDPDAPQPPQNQPANSQQQQPPQTPEEQMRNLMSMMANNLTLLSQTRPTRSAKMNKPALFTGRQEDVESFLTQCDLYVAPFSTMGDQMYALLSFVGGAASAWMQYKVNKVKTLKLTTYEQLKKELRAAFGDPDRKATAQWKLRRIRQGPMTTDEYIVAFEEHQHLTKFNEEALVHIFREGLNEALRSKILSSAMISVSSMGTAFTPSTDKLIWWKEMARQMDRLWRASQQWNRQTANTRPQNTRPPPR